MGTNYRKEARSQFLKYFRVWFIIIGILLIIAVALYGIRRMTDNASRSNMDAPSERVYDEAGILSADEEERLRSQIAKAEERLHMDIVIVTIDQPMEGQEAMRQQDAVSPRLEDVMEAYADNFWDDNYYGYNRSYEGDGVILVDNVYEGQGYWQLSTSGKAEKSLGDYDIDRLLDVVARYYNSSPYRGYSEFVDALADQLDTRGSAPLPWILVVVVPVIVALVFAADNLRQSKAKDTTAVNAYVVGGKPVMKGQKDEFIRKHVATRRIQTSSGSSGGGSRSSGGGGHHTSRSGASHGGGGRRH